MRNRLRLLLKIKSLILSSYQGYVCWIVRGVLASIIKHSLCSRCLLRPASHPLGPSSISPIVLDEFENAPLQEHSQSFLWCPGSLLSQHENVAWKWGWYSPIQPETKLGRRSGNKFPRCSGRRFSGHLVGELGPGGIGALLLPVMTLPTHFYLGFSSFLALYPLSHSCFTGSPPVVGGIMVPIYVHVPIPDTCEYITRTCEICRGILQMWFWAKDSGLSRWSKVNTRVLIRGKESKRKRCDNESRDGSAVGMSQEMQEASRTWKREMTDSFLDSPEAMEHYWHFDFSPIYCPLRAAGTKYYKPGVLKPHTLIVSLFQRLPVQN